MKSARSTAAPADRARDGFGLVELIVALTIFAIGILGLAATAVLAARAFNESDGIERAARLAETLLDSLVRADAVQDGQLHRSGVTAAWTVAHDSTVDLITLRVHIPGGAGARELEFHAASVDGW